MSIPLVHEDDSNMELVEAFHAENLLERCFFCKKETRFWHHATNNPVCPGCASSHNVNELPGGFSPKVKEKAPKRMTPLQAELREKDDDLWIEQRQLERKLSDLKYRRKLNQMEMVKHKLAIKRPIN